MTFIKYTHDGSAVVQPAALILSGLDQEETLEMQTLEKTIVLLKKDMTPMEKMETASGLIRLTNSLLADMISGFDDAISREEDEENEYEPDACGDELRIPAEVFEHAGIWGEVLRVQSIDGAVLITAEQESGDD